MYDLLLTMTVELMREQSCKQISVTWQQAKSGSQTESLRDLLLCDWLQHGSEHSQSLTGSYFYYSFAKFFF